MNCHVELFSSFNNYQFIPNSNPIRYADRPIRRTSSTLDRSSRVLYRALSPIRSGRSLLASACRENCCETATSHQIAMALVRARTRCSARACPIERSWATQHSKAQGPVSQVLLNQTRGTYMEKVWKMSIWKQGRFELRLLETAYCVWLIDGSVLWQASESESRFVAKQRLPLAMVLFGQASEDADMDVKDRTGSPFIIFASLSDFKPLDPVTSVSYT